MFLFSSASLRLRETISDVLYSCFLSFHLAHTTDGPSLKVEIGFVCLSVVMHCRRCFAGDASQEVHRRICAAGDALQVMH